MREYGREQLDLEMSRNIIVTRRVHELISLLIFSVKTSVHEFAQSAGAVEYTDCISVEG